MVKYVSMIALAVLFATPSVARGEKPAVAGVWKVQKMEFGGREIDPDRIVNKLFVYNENGVSKTYKTIEDYKADKPSSVGWYEMGEGNTIVMYEDHNGNGELDETERAAGKKMSWKIKDKSLILTFSFEDDGKEVEGKAVLSPFE